jgi:hypothetical protein
VNRYVVRLNDGTSLKVTSLEPYLNQEYVWIFKSDESMVIAMIPSFNVSYIIADPAFGSRNGKV